MHEPIHPASLAATLAIVIGCGGKLSREATFRTDAPPPDGHPPDAAQASDARQADGAPARVCVTPFHDTRTPGRGWTPSSLSNGLKRLWVSRDAVWGVGADTAAVLEGLTWTRGTWGLPFVAYDDVWGAAKDDVWLIGELRRAQLPSGEWDIRAELGHFDGCTIDVLPTTGCEPRALQGTSASDVWSAGGSSTDAVLCHYDGRAWAPIAAPHARAFTGVALGRRDVWLIDADEKLLRFDSARGLSQEAPVDGAAKVHRVFGAGADVWALADDDAGFTHVLRHDGSTWSTLLVTRGVNEVWASAPNDVWIGGGFASHFDGLKWQRVTPEPFESPSYYNVVLSIRGTGPNDVWIGRSSDAIHWGGP